MISGGCTNEESVGESDMVDTLLSVVTVVSAVLVDAMVMVVDDDAMLLLEP